MRKISDIISTAKSSRYTGFFCFTILFWTGILYVFSNVLGFNTIMVAPDFTRHYSVFALQQWFESVLGGKSGVVPWDITRFIGHPLFWQELFFMFSSYLSAAGTAYYLRTQKLPKIASYGGGLFFGFAGYSLTLLNAGHAGYFYLIMFVMFSFGLINRCFETGRLFYFAFLGAAIMWAEVQQPDIWLLFVFLIITYGIWRSFISWRKSRSFEFIRKVYPRFILTIVFALAVGASQIRIAMTSTLALRREQMSAKDAAVSSEEIASDTKTASPIKSNVEKAAEAHEKWIFSTNWSLPPEDILEFIIPGVFGNESMRPPYPYWGRLGRPDDSVFIKGKMMPNYRQHTVYLGLISTFLAVFGLFAWISCHRKKDERNDAVNSPLLDDIPFWAFAWIICLLFALGRYTPFYALAYHLPFLDYMRCPVKFHHLVEVSNAFLAGFGLFYMMRQTDDAAKTRRRFAYILAVAAMLLFVGAGYAKACSAAITTHIASLGLGQVADALSKYTVENIVHSAILATFISAIFFFSSTKSRKSKTLAICAAVCVIIGTADLAIVAKRYVVPLDVGPHNSSNPVIEAMLKVTGNRPANVMNYIGGGNGDLDWLSTSMRTHGFTVVSPDQSNQDNVYTKCFRKFSADPLHHWQATGSRFIIIPRKNAEQLIRGGAVKAVCDFEVVNGGKVRIVMPSSNSVVLAETIANTPLPALYHSWSANIDVNKQLDPVSGVAKLPQTDAPAPSAESSAEAETVTFNKMRQTPRSMSTSGTVTTKEESLLIFNEPASGDYEVFIDGNPTKIYTSDGMWISVVVPSGEHSIILRTSRRPTLSILSILASCTALAWLVAHCVFAKRDLRA